MRKNISCIVLGILVFLPASLFAQNKKEKEKEKKEGYEFTEVVRVPTTSVKDQQQTGTCWCFATTSFIETELLRMGSPELDLSEMFTVHQAYLDKAIRYIRYHGTVEFSQGGQAHDVLNMIRKHGFVPEEAYPGKNYGGEEHNHGEMVSGLKGYLDGLVKNRRGKLSRVWYPAFESVLDIYLGPFPAEFSYNGQTYTPQTFFESTGFNPDDYVEITSYSHHPFYEKFNLEVPDNWSYDLYYNLPVDEMMEVMDYALTNGYSVAWDGDVSESSMSFKEGVAIIPLNAPEPGKKPDFKVPGPEKEISQEMRQEAFDNFSTTDDHLMHLTGIDKDQHGVKYYRTKNSWGSEANDMKGYMNMSESYVRLETMAILVHKDAIPAHIKEKLQLK